MNLGFEIENGIIKGRTEWAGCPAWVPFFFDYAENGTYNSLEKTFFDEVVYVFDVEDLAPEWPELSPFKTVKVWRERTGLPRFMAIAKR